MTSPIPKAPTLKDVARKSGYSTATIRRVLYANGYVSDETRAAVNAAIAETGYRVNVVARGLRRRQTLTIGLLVHSIVPNPFFAGVAFGAEREAVKHGCDVLMYNVQGDAERERVGVESLAQRRVDAILFTHPIDARNVQLALDTHIPVVQLERLTVVPSHGVTVDNLAGTMEAMNHLLDMGHHRIAFAGSDPERHAQRSFLPGALTVEQERLAGYRTALEHRGIELDPELVLLGDYRAAMGYQAANRFLEGPAPPTAIFAASDAIAAGALQAFHELRLRVPDDISIVGFDDTLAGHLTPPLTTVAQPTVQLGETAVRIALACMQSGPGVTDRIIHERLSTHLHIRQSTAPVRRDSQARAI